jgi:hypothetical protein
MVVFPLFIPLQNKSSSIPVSIGGSSVVANSSQEISPIVGRSKASALHLVPAARSSALAVSGLRFRDVVETPA